MKALCLLSMQAKGLLDTRTFQDLYLKAILRMGLEGASKVFEGGEDVDEEVRKAIDAIRKGFDSKAYDTLDIAQEMAGRIGLQPQEIDVRLGEEGARWAKSSDALGVEQGKVIYLDERRVDPKTKEGREVIGHEVAHVAQVKKGHKALGVEAAEAEAKKVGERLSGSGPVEVPKVALPGSFVATYRGDEKDLVERLIEKGFDPDLARAIVGNVQKELVEGLIALGNPFIYNEAWRSERITEGLWRKMLNNEIGLTEEDLRPVFGHKFHFLRKEEGEDLRSRYVLPAKGRETEGAQISQRGGAEGVAGKAAETPWSKVVRKNFSAWDKDHDGFISREEANEVLSDPSVKDVDGAAVAALHCYLDKLEEQSNDEWGDENNGLTLRDLEEYEKKKASKGTKDPLVNDVEYAYFHGRRKIEDSSRELFAKGKPSLDALKQGPIGDCYFLAALGSFIDRDPYALTRIIRENRQGNKVISYTVSFPNKKFGEVTVPPPTDGEIARYSSAGEDGLWLVVMEKAYAVARSKSHKPDIQSEIGEGGQLFTGMSPFTQAGVDTDLLGKFFIFGTKKEETKKKLDAAFGRGPGSGKRRLVTAAIRSDNKYGLPKGHAYSVLGWDGENVTLRNPWGKNPVPEGEKVPRLKGPPGYDPYKTGRFVLSFEEFYEIFFVVAYEEE